MNAHLLEKYGRLEKTLSAYGSAAVAFSGGVDSTFLAKASHDILGNRTIAITVNTEAYPPGNLSDTRKLAALIGIRLVEIPVRTCDIRGFVENSPERCYFCKTALFTLMLRKAEEEGMAVLIDGTNADDAGDYRPGMRALAELGVKSPLLELGFAKPDIREASRELGLPTWDRQSFACLASRVPYGDRITPELLERVWRAEDVLRREGMKRHRVRVHGNLARIELDTDGMEALYADSSIRDRVVRDLKALGFTYITLDLSGYRTGSMNESLSMRGGV
jgi:pyridinium-3,5-biscarboxylic acid mononucleotide sulfurtransferase